MGQTDVYVNVRMCREQLAQLPYYTKFNVKCNNLNMIQFTPT